MEFQVIAFFQIGTKFWEVINKEHHIDGMGQTKVEPNEDLNVFYSQALNGRFVPRALLIDLYRVLFLRYF